MNEEQTFLLEKLQRDIEDLRFELARKTGVGSADVKVRIVQPSTIPSGALGAGAIDNANMFAAGVVDKAAIGADSVGNSEWDYEFADITISGTNTSGTAGVTSGSIPVGYYLTAFTTPTASYVQLVVSGTTLTATLAVAPGAGNSITIRTVLIKT